MSMTWSILPERSSSSSSSSSPPSSSNTKALPVRSCDSSGVPKPLGSDGTQESAIKVEQSQPGARSMDVAGQNDHLVAMHCDVADGFACIKDDNGIASIFAKISDSIGPMSLLMHCVSRNSFAIVGKRRHRRQQIHRAVQSELVQCSRWFPKAASQESIVGERQAHGPAHSKRRAARLLAR
eukprot:scaffold39233_cov77-Phaeocystis_antarctica.AAC.2